MTNALETTNPLFSTIEHAGKTWITSKKFHEDFKPTTKVANTNKAIREMPAYGKLCEEGHLLEADGKYVKSEAGSNLELALRSNFGNPILLIDPVAQKEIEHHFNVTTDQAIQSSRENAMLGIAGINLELIAQDPQTLLLLQMISKTKELEVNQKAIEQEQLEQRLQLLELKNSHDNLLLTQGDAQFFSIMGYASVTRRRVNTAEAKLMGKRASSICKDHGVNTGIVPDPRYGQVKTYPKEVLDQVFEEFFSEDSD
jgi:hypothetical protein